MAIGKLGVRGGGLGGLGVVSGGGSGHQLSGSSLDLNFATGQYFGGTLSALTSTSRASSGYATNSDGTLTLFGVNTPRIGRGTGLLVEEARTNLILQSSNLASGTWALTGLTTATAGVTAPDGTASWHLNEDTSASDHDVNQLITIGGTQILFTCYAKQAERSWLMLESFDASLHQCWFDLANGVVGAADAGVTSSIQALSNGWYRCTMNFVSSGGSFFAIIGASTANSVRNYQGVANSGIYIWGPQVEAAAFATSYIPTTTGAVTRAADVVTGAGAMPALFNVTTGVSYLMALGAIAPITASITTSFSTTTDGICTYYGGVGATPNVVFSGNNFGASASTIATAAVGAGHKIAFGGDIGGISGTLNGGAIVNPATMAAGAGTWLGSDRAGATTFISGYIKRFTVWNSKLSNAQLVILAT